MWGCSWWIITTNKVGFDLIDIGSISYTGGGTRTDRALELANSALFCPAGGDRSGVSNVLVVITDGKTNPGSKKYNLVLSPLRVSIVIIIFRFCLT